MQSNQILVIGSSNTDMVVVTDHFPVPGETILGGKFLMNPGGKGANQAVAAARLGGNVAFISKLGQDIFGEQTIRNLKEEGINVSGISSDPKNPSGVALITVDKHAENSIVVAPGANMSLEIPDIDKHFFLLDNAGIVLMQLEIPLKTIEYAANSAFKKGSKVILNPAPASILPDNLYSCLYLITPNETEAGFLTGIRITDTSTAKSAAIKLKNKGCKNVIITMGASGAYIYTDQIQEMVTAPSVKAIDTTAAGDTFNGALAVALSDGKDMESAVIFANKAAALAVTRMGAQSSVPTLHELQEYNFNGNH